MYNNGERYNLRNNFRMVEDFKTMLSYSESGFKIGSYLEITFRLSGGKNRFVKKISKSLYKDSLKVFQ